MIELGKKIMIEIRTIRKDGERNAVAVAFKNDGDAGP